MARNLNSARQNKRLEQLQKLADEADDKALEALLEQSDGRRVICRVARELGWLGETWDAGSARQTDYNAGRQSGAKTLMGWAERVAPDQFLAAIGEATRRDVEMVELAKVATAQKDEENDDV